MLSPLGRQGTETEEEPFAQVLQLINTGQALNAGRGLRGNARTSHSIPCPCPAVSTSHCSGPSTTATLCPDSERR